MIVGMIPGILIHFGIMEQYMNNAISVRTSEVQTQVRIIADHLLTYNYLHDNSNDVVNAELAQLSNLYDGRVLIIDSNLKIIKDTYGISEGKTIISEPIIRCFKGNGVSSNVTQNNFIEIVVPIEEKLVTELVKSTANVQNQSPRIVGVMLTSVSMDSIITSYEYLESRAYIIEILSAVILFGIAYFLSQRLLRPFEKITEAINEVKNGVRE